MSRFISSILTMSCKDIHTSSSLRPRRTCTVRSIFPNHLFQTFLTLCAVTVFKADPLDPASGKLYRDKPEDEATNILVI